MRLLKEIDPEGVSQRRQKHLRRRIYHSKVYGLDFDSCNYSDHSVVFIKKRVPISYGMPMVMTSLQLLE